LDISLSRRVEIIYDDITLSQVICVVKNQFIYLGGYKIYLQDYLKKKHMDYCYSKNEMISESDWVNEVLNRDMPREDRLSYPSVNQWMNGGRFPDSKNIVRLIQVFGPEVMPYLGIKFSGELGVVVDAWYDLTEEDRNKIYEIVMRNGPELAQVKEL
jgi:hypothetical protein